MSEKRIHSDDRRNDDRRNKDRRLSNEKVEMDRRVVKKLIRIINLLIVRAGMKMEMTVNVISGKKDEIVPHSHSDILFKKAKVIKKSVFIDEAMHNNLYEFGIEKSVIKFNLELWK